MTSINFGFQNKYILIAIDQAIVALTGIFITMLITKAYGLDGLGLYVLAYMILLLCNMIHSAFVAMPISTRLSRESVITKFKYDDSYYATSHLLVVIGLLLSAVPAYFSLAWIQLFSEAHAFYFKIVFCIPCLLTFNYLRSMFLADFDYWSVFKMDLSFSILIITFLFFGAAETTGDIFTLLAISWMASCLLGKRFWTKFPFNISGLASVVACLWEDGKWLFGYKSIAFLKSNAVILVLGWASGAASVGLLRIIQTLFGPLNILISSLESFLPQLGSKIYLEAGKSSTADFLIKVFFYLSVIWAVYSIFLFFSGPYLVRTFFMAAEVDVRLLVCIQSALVLVIILNTLFPIFIRIVGDLKSLTFSPLLELCVLTYPGILLIQRFSVAGALVWYLLGITLSVVILFIFYRFSLKKRS